MVLADAEQILDRQRHATSAGFLGRAFDVGEIILTGLLPDPDEQLGKMTPAGPGLGE